MKLRTELLVLRTNQGGNRDVGKETKILLFKKRKKVEGLRNEQHKFCTVTIKSAKGFMNTVILNKRIKQWNTSLYEAFGRKMEPLGRWMWEPWPTCKILKIYKKLIINYYLCPTSVPWRYLRTNEIKPSKWHRLLSCKRNR